MEIKELVQKAHDNAVNKGFWEDKVELKEAGEQILKELDLNEESTKDACLKLVRSINNSISTKLMLIVSELAEAQEALRKNDVPNFKEEIADVAIRLADLCGGLEIDLEAEIIKKMEKNKERPYLHGKAF